VSDPILDGLLREAGADPVVLGVLLLGSRAAGREDAESDYDVFLVLTEAAYEAKSSGDKRNVDGVVVEIGYTSAADLERVRTEPSWWTPGFARARVLLDKTGGVAALVAHIAAMPEERAAEEIRASYDAYLNSFVRSLKAWRRGDELAGRFEAYEAVRHLVRALFALERRWAPYPTGLVEELPSLEEMQGWDPGYLAGTIVELLRSGGPVLQQELEARVEPLMRRHGAGSVLDAWTDIEAVGRVRDYSF
jgi:predicted nucleotidyltransferase